MFRTPDDKTKYSANWRYVELAKFSTKNGKNSLYRIQNKDGSPTVVDIDEIDSYLEQYGDVGFYTSVWQYNSKSNIVEATKMSSLYFDIDSKDIEQSYADMSKLRDYLINHIPRDSMHVYFTGLKGFHVEVEALALGVTPSSDGHVIFRFIANKLKEELGLETLDFSVYDARRIWRYPNTKHQVSGLYKVEIFDDAMDISEIQRYADQPRELNNKEQKLIYGASKWYREFEYSLEQENNQKSKSTFDKLQNFSKYGSGSAKSFNESEMVFDPKRLLDSCHAIMDLWDKAERTHHLDHLERLFLCSILSYTDESLEYLYAILSNCSDFDPNTSKAHIEDWLRRREMGIGGRPYSCKVANAQGIGCGDCDLDVKKKWVNISGVMVETEEEAQPSPIRFGYSRKGKGY